MEDMARSVIVARFLRIASPQNMLTYYPIPKQQHLLYIQKRAEGEMYPGESNLQRMHLDAQQVSVQTWRV